MDKFKLSLKLDEIVQVIERMSRFHEAFLDKYRDGNNSSL